MDYYVYRHVDDEGEVVYVGKGRADRAWSVRSIASRQPEHIDWFAKQNPFECVECIEFGLTSDEALAVERQYILKYDPKFNKRKSSSDYKTHNQKLDEDDAFLIKYYFLPYTQRNKEVAEMFGITRGSVSQIRHNKVWRHV